MATVHIPPQMRDLTGGAREVEVAGRTVREVVEALDARYPGFAARVVVEGKIAPGLAVSVDNVVTSLGLLGKVEAGSVVHFVRAVAGG
jgi:molybdopterin converting factor small subunit